MTNPNPPRVGWHNTAMAGATYVPDPAFFVLLLTPRERAEMASAFESARLAAIREQQPARVFTGYMPAEQRRDVRHRMYRDGLRKPPRRATAADRACIEAQKWGLAS